MSVLMYTCVAVLFAYKVHSSVLCQWGFVVLQTCNNVDWESRWWELNLMTNLCGYVCSRSKATTAKTQVCHSV